MIYIERYVTSEDLAYILNITSRRVNQLASENVITREQNGKFDIQKSAENFFRHKFRSDKDKDINYDKEHALLEKVKREKAEIDLETRKGELLVADDVEHLMASMIITFKSRLLSLPTKCAPQIMGKKSLAEVVEILKDAVYEALNELK